MRTFVAFITAALLFACTSVAQEKKPQETQAKALQKIGAAYATNHFGETMIVTGMVAQVSIREKIVYLNLEKKYPESPFTGVIFASATNGFGNLKAIEGKSVELSGKIEAYRSKPQIMLTNANQLKVIPSAAASAKQ